MKNTKTLIVIAGMHRSGTSLFACICHHLGANLGKDLITAPPEDNKIGYWEPQAVVDMHEEAFKKLNLRSDDCTLFDKEQVDKELESRIATWLDQFNDSQLVCVKDPRICRFLPSWIDIAEQNKYQPVFAIPLRNPLEVANSLAKRGSEYKDLQRSLMWWLVHVLEAERDTRNHKRVVFTYLDLINNWQQVARKISSELIIKWPNRYVHANDKIHSLLDYNLYRNRQDASSLKKIDKLGWASEVFEIMQKPEINCKRLDKIYQSVEEFLTPLNSYDLKDHGSKEEIEQWQQAITNWKQPLWKKTIKRLKS